MRLQVIAATAALVAGLAGCGGEPETYTPPEGYISTNAQEEKLLLLHEAFGTFKPGYSSEKLQRALLAAGWTLCDQLDRKVITAAQSTAISKNEGVSNAEVVTDFAISALCPQHEESP